MAKTNIAAKQAPKFTYEGAPASQINAKQQLRRLVMAHMLWEDQFYVDGQSSALMVAAGVKAVKAEDVAAIAIEAREKMKLRHIPLWLVRCMAALPSHRHVVADTLARIIQRPDELSEYVSLYWKGKRQPLSAQSKKGLARAFTKFNEYQLAKYNQDGAVKLRDVLFLSHAKPLNDEQAAVWKRLVDGTLTTPDTWEVALSAGADKGETFTRLVTEKKLGGMALLRNLRNMMQSGVTKEFAADALAKANFSRVLPFRFIAAAKHVPQWEDVIEPAMLNAAGALAKLPGKTAIVVDNSGSMYGTKVSAKSEMDRSDAACALAILAREICEDVVVVGFGSTASVIPARRGFALRDAIQRGPGGGTYTQSALSLAAREGYDRLILITDEQSHQAISGIPNTRKYVINVAAYRNGIGYGEFTHIDGWSEAVLDYIRQAEESE